MESSSFTASFSGDITPGAELLPLPGGSTCDCYRVKLYGKLHFLKRLKPELHSNPLLVAAFNKEFETGYRLEHPNLVRYISRNDSGDILMEYIDGETLTDFVAAHPDYFKSRDHADTFLRQLVSVMDYLHGHQVLHLDLKPDNILITRIGHNVKLIDLGCCYTDTYIDTMGQTDRFAAPEQLDGSGDVDARTDVFAIGRILETLPCAQRYAKIIEQCTRADKSQRYQSAGDILRDLDRRRWSRRWLWLLLIVPVTIVAYLYFNFPVPSDLQSPDAGANLDTITQSRPDSVIAAQPTRAEFPEDQSSALPATADAPQSPVAESKKPDQVDSEPVTAQEVADIKATQTERKQRLGKNPSGEVLAQRRELQAIAEPIFNRLLATYRDSAYNKINKAQFERLSSEFRYTFLDKTYPVWQKCNAAQLMGSSDFQSECNETVKYFTQNLVYRMRRNAGERSFANKHYNYYDAR